jgi:hypothetical protein
MRLRKWESIGRSSSTAAIMTAELLQSAVQSHIVSSVQMAEFSWAYGAGKSLLSAENGSRADASAVTHGKLLESPLHIGPFTYSNIPD